MATRESKIVITAEDKTKAAFENVKRNVESAARSADALHSSFKMFTTAGGVLAALEGINLFQKYKGILETADAFNKLAQKTGVVTETLSTYAYSAKLSGVSQEDLSTGLKKLAVNMAAAAGGAKEQGEVFKAMGVSVTDAGGKLRSTDSVLEDIAERFGEWRDGPEKAALAVELFGKSGDTMIPLLNNFRTLNAEAKQFGAVYGSDFARKAEEFNDNLTRLALAGERAKVAFLSKGGLFDALVQLVEQMVEGVRVSGGFKKALFELGTINPFRSMAGNLSSLQEDIEVRQQRIARLTESQVRNEQSFRNLGVRRREAVDTSGERRQLQAEIATMERQREFLKFQQRQDALSKGEGTQFLDARDLRARGAAASKPVAPVINKPAEQKSQTDAMAALLQQLDMQIAKTQELSQVERVMIELQDQKFDKSSKAARMDAVFKAAALDAAEAEKATRDLVQSLDDQIAKVGELTVVQEMELKLQERKYREASQGSRDLVVARAKELEQARQAQEYYKAEVKAIEDATKAIADRYAASQSRANQIRDQSDPTRSLQREILEARKLQEEGFLTAQEAIAAEWDLQNKLQDVMDRNNKSTEQLADGARQIGLAFQSAFEDAILEGKKFGQVMDALAKDIARALIRATITQPMVDAVAKNSSTWVNALVNAFGGARAEGGPVSHGSMYLVGERGPELFVPQSSGTIVPNGGMGGGGVSVVQNINIDSRTDAAAIRQMLEANRQRTVAQIADMQQRGQLRLA